MAAGLTVAAGKIEALADFLDERLAAEVARAATTAPCCSMPCSPRAASPRLCATALEGGGPYGAGWPAPRVAAGPVSLVKADVVGTDHLRLIAAGDDGRRFKAIAFRMADSPLGQALLAAPPQPQAVARRPDEERRIYGNVAAELHARGRRLGGCLTPARPFLKCAARLGGPFV